MYQVSDPGWEKDSGKEDWSHPHTGVPSKLHQKRVDFFCKFIRLASLEVLGVFTRKTWCKIDTDFWVLLISRCRTGSRTDDNGTEHPGVEGKRLKRWPNNISRSRWVWMIMMMPQRMRKHSVEKTRVSSKLVSVSPPPPLRSALSQHDQQIIAVPTSRRPTNSHHLSTTKTLQSWVDSVASDLSKKNFQNHLQNLCFFVALDVAIYW